MQHRSQKLVIVGGGVIGLSTAYYALKEGYEVTVLDRDGADGSNCSSANAGMIVPQPFHSPRRTGSHWQRPALDAR